MESSKASKKNKKPSCKHFNPRTPIKFIEFEPGLLFMNVAALKHAIIDYAVEQKRDFWLSKNDL